MNDDDRVLHSQAWNFFEVVAAQRLKVINFYITIATLLAGGQWALLQSAQYRSSAAGLGLLLTLLSFIFWRWDRRSSDLIKLAEETLRYYEGRLTTSDTGPTSHLARLFLREHQFTEDKKKNKLFSKLFSSYYFTYRVCLNLLYTMFSLIGIFVIFLSIVNSL